MTDIGFISQEDRQTLVVVEEMLAYALRELSECTPAHDELSAAIANARKIAASLTDAESVGRPRQQSATN